MCYCYYRLAVCRLHISKVKSKGVPWLPSRQWREEVQLLLILNLCTRWGWVVSIMPRLRFTPVNWPSSTHWIGSWVGLDTEARRKILCFCWGSNPSLPVCSQTLHWLSYPSSLHTLISNCRQLLIIQEFNCGSPPQLCPARARFWTEFGLPLFYDSRLGWGCVTAKQVGGIVDWLIMSMGWDYVWTVAISRPIVHTPGDI
jgi:hypothetical protein